MASMLDQRPARRSPVLFGRALVEQRRAEAQAAQSERDDVRADAAQAATERHQKLQDQIAAQRLELETRKANAEAQVKLHELQQQNQQMEAFSAAQRQVSQLKPDDPLLSAKVAQIQADYPVLFAGKGTNFGHALGGMVTELFQQQKALDAAKAAKVKAADEFTLKTGIAVPLDSKGQPDIAAAGKARAEAAKTATAGMVPSSYTEPTTGVVMKAPPDAQKDIHDRQKLFMDDYHAVEKERIGIKPDKAYKNAADDPRIKLLDERRMAALNNLQSVGINLTGETASPVVPTDSAAAPVLDSAPTETAAPVDNMDLARQALDDPAATALHKSAARKILGYQDETLPATQ